ncbi:hypothetical protein RFI_00550 [Reticulomyxa filosa]|uniref:Uncharacterized protein n=1 Tax=Reticulomyxa filosa TaxID=46433 RepID=X6PEP3_RETFI|nr:hypothetical protein RFI_00550 [Reticulomyxa filosa]|eukprot:ETO36509.1 hypothetical protein RFI_00550 [Reticulomyxa filosa]
MGHSHSSSSVIITNDIVSVAKTSGEESYSNEDVIQITYGPNIAARLLGYDEQTRELTEAAETIYNHVIHPSNRNQAKLVLPQSLLIIQKNKHQMNLSSNSMIFFFKKKADEILGELTESAFEQGRAVMDLSEFESNLITDIDNRVFAHKEKYGTNEKLDKLDIDNICREQYTNVAGCLAETSLLQDGKTTPKPFYDKIN